MPFQSSFLFSFLLFLSTGVLSHLLYNPHGRFVQAAIAALNSLQTNAKTLALQRKTGGRDLAKSLADVKNYAKRMAIKVRETNETKMQKSKVLCRTCGGEGGTCTRRWGCWRSSSLLASRSFGLCDELPHPSSSSPSPPTPPSHLPSPPPGPFHL